MTEFEIKDTSKKTMIAISQSVKILFLSDSKISKVTSDELMINFFFRNLTSKNLERRIKGITYLNKYLEILERKETYR